MAGAEVWGVLGGNEGTGRGRTHGGSGGVGTGTNVLCFVVLQADFLTTGEEKT